MCRFERCWPAMGKDVHGVVLVHNPDQPQQERELEKWSENTFSEFTLKISLSHKCMYIPVCMVCVCVCICVATPTL